MKKFLFPLFALLILSSFAMSQGLYWHNVPGKAFQEAQASGKLVFVDVYTEWCSWCKKLDNETFQDASFIETARKFVLLKVDADLQPDFKTKYQIKGYPSLLFLNAQGVEACNRVLGYMPASSLVPVMKKALAETQREISWYRDVQQALSVAKETGKPVFVDVYTEWCSWCKKLDKETFIHPKFLAIASKFVLLKVDAEKEVAFATKYNVRAYPTMLFLKGSGEEVHRIKGFLPADELVPAMEKVLGNFSVLTTLVWHTNIQSAFEEAMAQRKLVFVDAYMDNCSWCTKLEKETFTHPDFIGVAQLYVLLKIDGMKETDFSNKYKVRAFPTMLFLKASGEEIFRFKGFYPADEVVPQMKKILEENQGFSLAK